MTFDKTMFSSLVFHRKYIKKIILQKVPIHYVCVCCHVKSCLFFSHSLQYSFGSKKMLVYHFFETGILLTLTDKGSVNEKHVSLKSFHSDIKPPTSLSLHEKSFFLPWVHLSGRPAASVT